MEQRPSWKADRSSPSQEITRILWNPKVHYRVLNIPPPLLILSQINPVYASRIPFLESLVCQVVYFPQVSPSNACMYPLFIRATLRAQLVLDLITRLCNYGGSNCRKFCLYEAVEVYPSFGRYCSIHLCSDKTVPKYERFLIYQTLFPNVHKLFACI